MKPVNGTIKTLNGESRRRRGADEEVCAAVYDPKILRIMCVAFGDACNSLPAKVVDTEKARWSLARRIIIHFDRGEQDSNRLARLAAQDLRRHARRSGKLSG